MALLLTSNTIANTPSKVAVVESWFAITDFYAAMFLYLS